MNIEITRLADGRLRAVVDDGREEFGDSLEDLVRRIVPDAPDDLIAHLGERDSGTWRCELP